LIYGDESANPKLFLIVTRISGSLDEPFSQFENDSLRLLSNQPTPVRILRFEENNFVREIAISISNNTSFNVIKTADLYSALFEPYGLTADPNIAAKQVNSATSSTFHDWQRSFLSGKLTVTDIDLIVYNEAFEILKIFELKRSFYELNVWKPYSADFRNFQLLKRAFDNTIPIYILYNTNKGTPRVEDISLLRVFKISNDTPTITDIFHEIEGKQGFNFPIDTVFT
jgi:hypothetical protein